MFAGSGRRTSVGNMGDGSGVHREVAARSWFVSSVNASYCENCEQCCAKNWFFCAPAVHYIDTESVFADSSCQDAG